MQLFYTENIADDTAIFDAEESLHGIKVLRMRKGDSMTFTDGSGKMFEGIVTNDDPRKMVVKITSVIDCFEKKGYRLHLAVSPLKNNDRFEWLIEKAVEIGVDEITPLLCERTEKPGIRRDRIIKIIISAMKQSLKSSKPILNEPVTFEQFINSQHPEQRIIAHCNDEIVRYSLSESIIRGNDYLLAIGPEGDFTPDEVNNAIASGFKSVHIGNNRLRTETAGIAACCSVYLKNI